MSEAREEILRRIREALRDVPPAEQPSDVPVTREYRRVDGRAPAGRVGQLEERLLDYGATVRRVPESEIGGAVSAACQEWGLRRVVVPAALPRGWRPQELEVIEDHALAAECLDQVDAAVTGCAAAVAETGTLLLDGQGRSGRRAITLVPDHHICVVTAGQVLGLVPEAIAHVAGAATEQRLPITLISGPSATSDIELTRIDGVHGPRHLLVLIACPSERA